MKANSLSTCAAAAIATLLAGCAMPNWKSDETTAAKGASGENPLISQQQSRINNLEAELRARDSELKQKDSDIQAQAVASRSSGANGLFPPNAKPGHCYARVLIPANWGETSETVMVKEASQRVEVIPARYESGQERVLTREASTRLETVPARYETVEERVMVRPESKRIEEVPATYKTVSEQVLVSPARTEWKRGPAASFGDSVVQSRTSDTGEVMCLVEIPAQYKTVTRTVVDRPASTREVVIPAEYKMIKKTVLAEPPRTVEIDIPAEYGTVEVQKLVSPAQERRIEIPAEYAEVTRRTVQGQDRLEWREVLCQVNMTGDKIRTLQTALNEKGYDVGPVDGVLGNKTLQSANRYAERSGLPFGSNYITIEVAQDLGLDIL